MKQSPEQKQGLKQREIIESEGRPRIQRMYERVLNPLQCCVCSSYETYEKKRYCENRISYSPNWYFIGDNTL